MRWIWLLIFVVLSQVCVAEPASVLVFIKTKYAGPTIPEQIDDHSLWVKWPQREARDVLWPVLSVTTGQDWRITESELTVSSIDTNWVFAEHVSFVNRGIAIQLQQNLDGRHFEVLGNPAGGASRLALIAAISPKSDLVKVLSPTQRLEENGLYVTEARHWDEVAAVRKRTKGRILVLEWSDEPARMLSHVWLLGEGWPIGTPRSNKFRVTGTLALTEIGKLLAVPKRFTFTSLNRGEVARRWGGESPGISFGLCVVAAFFAVILGIATWCVSQERNSALARAGLDALLVLPACLSISGAAARYLGPELLWLCVPPLIVILVLLGQLIGKLVLVSKGAISQISVLFGINVVALSLGEPSWSALSSVFQETDRPLSGMWVGAWLLSLIGIASISAGKPTLWAWGSRLLLAAAFGISLVNPGWCAAAGIVVLCAPFWAVIVGERWVPNWLVAGAIFGCGAINGLRHAVTFAPQDRFVTFWDIPAVNLWWYGFGLRDPAFWFAIGLCILLAILGDRFYFRQLKRTIQNSLLVKTTSFVLVAGLLLPASEPKLYDSLIAGFLLWLVVLHREALVSPEPA